MKYKFKEGQDYYTIEQGEVVKSYWDFISEEQHTKDTVYYKTHLEAIVNLTYDYAIENLEHNYKKDKLMLLMDEIIKEINNN